MQSTTLGVCSYLKCLFILKVPVRLLMGERHCLVIDWGGEGPPI